jgi:hypothetical protein
MPNGSGATAVPAMRGAADGPGLRASEKATSAHVVARRRTALVVHSGRLGLLLGAIALWQLASGPLINPYFASKPSEIVDAFARLIATGRFFPNLWLTVQEALYGYLIGASLGVVAAVVLGSSARLLAILEPFLLVIFATPSVALAPLIIVWLGLGIAPKIVLAARIFAAAPHPHPGVKSFGVQLITLARAMRDIEARATQRRDRRLDLQDIAQSRADGKIAAQIDSGKSGRAERIQHVSHRQLQHLLEHAPEIAVKQREIALGMHETGRVAVAPFDLDGPAIAQHGSPGSLAHALRRPAM